MDFILQWTWKTKFLGTSLGGCFDPSWLNLSLHQDFCSQLPAWSVIFCLLVDVAYCPCDLKFIYPTINLAFLEMIVKIKLLTTFCLHSFKWFYLQMSSETKIFFLSCLRYCDQGLTVVIKYYQCNRYRYCYMDAQHEL